MELSELFSPGSHLSDVPPDFRGMPYREWRLKEISRQADEWRKTRLNAPMQKWQNRAIWTPRDSYGMKGV